MTTTICIVRHGETDWNAAKRVQGREDIELNENGRRQASGLASRLEGMHWDVIISSPLKRAAETAQIIRQTIKAGSIIVNEKFIERDFGKASGMTYGQWKDAFPDQHIPGREVDDELEKRVYEGLAEVVEKYTGRKIVLVTHGAVINSLLKTISEGLINIGETNIKNACINLIEHDGKSYRVKLYNSLEIF